MENDKEALPYYPVEVTPYGIISLQKPSNQPTEGGTSMKKKIASLTLVLALCLSLLPVTAFAEESEEPVAEPIKTSISTVKELLQFAKDVNEGKYDDKKDAVVSLEADLDLNGTSWVPIGSNFDNEGNLQHYFSGKCTGTT